MEPAEQFGGSLIRALVNTGTLAKGGLDKSLGFAISLGRVRLGEDLAKAEAFASP
jgi:hypothetical protein